jgi:hypothetical protein
MAEPKHPGEGAAESGLFHRGSDKWLFMNEKMQQN